MNALDDVPPMIKSLTLKAEAFNQCRTGSHLDSNTIKEVCFDIQIQLLDFISNSFKDIRHAADLSLQSVALHGVGGVGKTSIASSYAEKKYYEEVYDVVAWIHGEKDSSLRQSFTNIAMRLKLPGAQSQADEENQILVHHWLQSTDCKWLLVYDNVESVETLRPYWPRPTKQGRAIITTRNHALGLDPAESSLEVPSWDPETGADCLIFLLKKRIGQDLESENISARDLSKRLSGHALAISQMAGLIYEGEYSIKEFTSMYLQSPHSVHAMDALADLWKYAFESLDKNSFSLLGIISFLQPDGIPPEIYKPSHKVDLPQHLGFLKQHISLVTGPLRQLATRALIKRDKDSRVLTIHRLIQTQFRYFMDHEQHQQAFDNAVTLLDSLLPQSDEEQGQLYDLWEKYNFYLQTVISLRDSFDEDTKEGRVLKASEKFCRILNDYQRTCEVNRAAASTCSSKELRVDLEATILSHLSQVAEQRGEFSKSIKACEDQIRCRKGESPQKKVLLAYSVSNLAISHSSANEFSKAFEYYQEARMWWKLHFDEKCENRQYAASILVHEARCMIELGKFAEAEEMLDTTIAQVKADISLNFGTLSYAQFCRGTLARCRGQPEHAEAHYLEAQNTWIMGDQSRVHPFNASIMYNIGACCLLQGKVEAAIKHIRDSMEVTRVFERILPVHHGRNLFKLSEALTQDGDEMATEAETLRDMAESYLKKQNPDATETGTERDDGTGKNAFATIP
ncbi:hypothetical protein PG999_003009 [Apiospora kogelbergensis]|uniref:NB-ARC domain-containing protein n=1 Tax=Apiospora kogelbergensis TaxID=1337665 RepID=A0AAW0R9R3_9PEZI